jgi:hypothetical protein
VFDDKELVIMLSLARFGCAVIPLDRGVENGVVK